MEIIKFNAFDTEGKLVYCSYRKFKKGEKGTQIERSLPFDKFIDAEQQRVDEARAKEINLESNKQIFLSLEEILAGSCYSVFLEESPSMQLYEKKFLDDTPNTDLTKDEINYFKDIVKRACIDEEWDDLLKPPSVDEQVEDFIKEFFEDEDNDDELEQKDYLEEFFKELEEDTENDSDT